MNVISLSCLNTGDCSFIMFIDCQESFHNFGYSTLMICLWVLTGAATNETLLIGSYFLWSAQLRINHNHGLVASYCRYQFIYIAILVLHNNGLPWISNYSMPTALLIICPCVGVGGWMESLSCWCWYKVLLIGNYAYTLYLCDAQLITWAPPSPLGSRLVVGNLVDYIA